jgi:hypothetical protein
MSSLYSGFEVEARLFEEASRAVEWYDTKGMKVAKPPFIPEAVARWIVSKCVPHECAEVAETQSLYTDDPGDMGSPHEEEVTGKVLELFTHLSKTRGK